MVAVRDGIHGLDEQLRLEDEEAQKHPPGPTTSEAPRNRRGPLTEMQDEARRRLIRQATAANQAIVKGNCLMVMQLLTGR